MPQVNGVQLQPALRSVQLDPSPPRLEFEHERHDELTPLKPLNLFRQARMQASSPAVQSQQQHQYQQVAEGQQQPPANYTPSTPAISTDNAHDPSSMYQQYQQGRALSSSSGSEIPHLSSDPSVAPAPPQHILHQQQQSQQKQQHPYQQPQQHRLESNDGSYSTDADRYLNQIVMLLAQFKSLGKRGHDAASQLSSELRSEREKLTQMRSMAEFEHEAKQITDEELHSVRASFSKLNQKVHQLQNDRADLEKENLKLEKAKHLLDYELGQCRHQIELQKADLSSLTSNVSSLQQSITTLEEESFPQLLYGFL